MMFIFILWGLLASIAWVLPARADNPFLSPVCNAWLNNVDDYPLSLKFPTVFTVIFTRNSDKSLLLESVKSILAGSSIAETYQGKQHTALLEKLIIIDDNSESPVKEWSDWKSFSPDQAKHLEFLRNAEVRGQVESKNDAVRYIQSNYPNLIPSSMVVFLDKPVVVTPQWLIPLANTLSKYPKAMVYPVVDILARSSSSTSESIEWEVARADEVVAAFDWAFLPRWEVIAAGSTRPARLKYTLDTTSSSTEIISPAVPNVFAINVEHFLALDTFDTALYSSEYSQENIDLSLRNWLCGGVVLQQTCSHVAQQYSHLQGEATAGVGVTQQHIDSNTMNMAQRWLSRPVDPHLLHTDPETHADTVTDVSAHSHGGHSQDQGFTYREMAFETRFMHRVPYTVNTAVDAVRAGPTQSFHLPNDRQVTGRVNERAMTCVAIDWFLQAIYPGLLQEVHSTLDRFQTHLNHNDYLSLALQPFVAQYSNLPIFSIDEQIQTKLQARATHLLKQPQSELAALLGIPNAKHDFHFRHNYEEPKAPKKHNGQTREERLEAHNERVRYQLACEDFVDVSKPNFCAQETQNGDVTVCDHFKASLLTVCPRTCGFCDSSLKFCEDFYLVKCKQWAQNNLCETTDRVYGPIKEACRKSCGSCTPLYGQMQTLLNGNKPQERALTDVQEHAALNNPQPPQLHVELSKDASSSSSAFDALPIDPTQLHRDYLAGLLPDRFDNDNSNNNRNTKAGVCKLNGVPDGLLLARVHVNMDYSDHINTGDVLNHNRLPVANSHAQHVRIFCGIYTMAKNHATNVAATRTTWAKKCDGFIAFSTETDDKYSAMRIEHDGDEHYDNMWQKSRAIWKFIYANLRDHFDYFLLGGDDMFYIVENLRAYLGSEEIHTLQAANTPLFLGRKFQPPKQLVFNSGGAGYLLNTAALEILGSHLDAPACYPKQRGFWEDVNVANCLLKGGNVVPYDTRDPLLRERFHPFNPGNHLTYRIPPRNPDWYAKYNPDLKVGYDCCSDESISFHYVPAALMYTLYDYVYHCQDKLVQGQ